MCRTGVDVDRFDYMLRDCMNVTNLLAFHPQLGLNCSYNYDRIIKGARCILNSNNEYEADIIQLSSHPDLFQREGEYRCF